MEPGGLPWTARESNPLGNQSKGHPEPIAALAVSPVEPVAPDTTEPPPLVIYGGGITSPFM